VTLGVTVFIVAAMWKVFTKADKPGWAAIVPIYNVIVMLKIAGRPMWWLLLMFIPVGIGTARPGSATPPPGYGQLKVFGRS
jgi:hypothetical protein